MAQSAIQGKFKWGKQVALRGPRRWIFWRSRDGPRKPKRAAFARLTLKADLAAGSFNSFETHQFKRRRTVRASGQDQV